MTGGLAGGGATILARYGGGECPACERPILRGDLIVRRAGVWMHENCDRAPLPLTDDVPAGPDEDEEAHGR